MSGPDHGAREAGDRRPRPSTVRSDRDPFAVPPEERDPSRRFRGRLAAPVTVWTALTPGGEPAGITVASVLVAEGPGAEGTGAGGPLVGGDVARVLGLVDPLSDFWEAADASRRFVVHVVPEARWRVADQLAGRSPVALERFDGLRLTPTPWGPVLDELTTRAYCSLAGAVETGGALLVQGTIEKLDLPDGPPEPLVYLRGAYRGVRPVNRPSGSAG